MTVAQFLVGSESEVGPIMGFEGRTYNLDTFTDQIAGLVTTPTLIVLGPSSPTWTESDNRARLTKFLPHLLGVTEKLWHLSPTRREMILGLSA